MSEPGGGDGESEIQVLRLIWNEMKALRASLEARLDATRKDLGDRIDQTNQRLDQTNQRLDAVRAEMKEELDVLRCRMTESEVRLATATAELASEARDLSRLIREWREEHRADRIELRTRIGRIEDHLGFGPRP